MTATVNRYYYNESTKSTVAEAVQCIDRESYDSRYLTLKANGFSDSKAMYDLVQSYLVSQDPYQKVKDEWYRLQKRIEAVTAAISAYGNYINDIQRLQKAAYEAELNTLINNRNRMEVGRFTKTTTDWGTTYDSNNIPHRVQGSVNVEVVLPEGDFYPWLAFYRGVYDVAPPEYAISANLMEQFEIATYKTDAMEVIDSQAEAERLKIISPGAGLAAIYIYKATEARAMLDAYAKDPNFVPTETDYPFMFAEVGITGATAKDVAQVIHTNQQTWTQIGMQIEAIRLNAKRMVGEASKRSEISEVMTNLRWDCINPTYY